MKNSIDEDFENLLEFLKNSRGFDFTGYKRASLIRRIDKRMATVGIVHYSDYIDYLTVHSEEFTQLFNTILINVTNFFRDPLTWEFLKNVVVPDIVNESRNGSSIIRVWSVGCASGEETYSIAMLFAEVMGVENFTSRIKIYATDLDEEALSKARSGVYTAKDVEDVPEPLLKKYFGQSGDEYIVSKDLRRSVIFGRLDVIYDAPISHIDLLLCRNLLMYFNTETQARVLARLHFSIKEGGFLVLGRAEMLLAYSTLFSHVDIKTRIFRSASVPSIRDRLQLMTINGSEESTRLLADQFQVREASFNASPVPQIVVDIAGILSQVNNRARLMFNLSNRDIGRPFQDLELSYRPAAELRSSIVKAQEDQEELTLTNINWERDLGEKSSMEILISPLKNGDAGLFASLISFIDVTKQARLYEKLERTNLELETTMGELQSSNEELETTNEELQSTIEELETTNEELQSSNEEMETMNEELQSTNEELESMSVESKTQSEELFHVNKLLESIVTSLRGSIIVTDGDLKIQSWNRKSEDMWGLRAEEVQNRPLFNLDIGLDLAKLRPLIGEVISGKREHAELSLEARDRRGRDILCKISILPLSYQDNGIQGSILLVQDGSL